MPIAPITALAPTPHWLSTLSARQKTEYFAKNLVPAYAPPSEETETTRISGANGASVAVTRQCEAGPYDISYTLHLGDSQDAQLDLEFSGDLSVSKTKDGLYSIYFSNGNLTRTYAADGSFTELSGDQTDVDGGRIFISTSGEAIQGGSGNDAFLVYASASINTGDGDNTVILKGVASHDTGLTTTAAGNNNACLVTGSGNNRIICEGSYAGNMKLGDGDNTVSIRHLTGVISVGNGNSSFSIGTMSGIIGAPRAATSQHAQRTFNIASMSGRSMLQLGNGTNTMNIGSMSGSASLLQTIGEMKLDIGSMSGFSTVNCLTSNSSVSVGTMDNRASVSASGNSSVRVDVMSGSSTVSTGNCPAELWGTILAQNGRPKNLPAWSTELYVGEMRDSATLSLSAYNLKQMLVIDAMYDNARLSTEALGWFGQNGENPNINIVIGTADESAGLPNKYASVALLSELEPEELNEVESMLAEWRAECEKAGLPAAKQDLWASLNGEMSDEEKLLQRVALLVPWDY